MSEIKVDIIIFHLMYEESQVQKGEVTWLLDEAQDIRLKTKVILSNLATIKCVIHLTMLYLHNYGLH